MKRILLIGIILTLAVLAVSLNRAAMNPPDGEIHATLISSSVAPKGFLRADGKRPLEFPADFGPHPDYQTEWWYYTGNLKTEAGRHFGFQLTFFRRGLAPPSDRQIRKSTWACDQVYMGHFAISDPVSKEHYVFERFSRGAAGLAGAEAEPFKVWLENWQVQLVDGDRYRLTAKQDGIEIELLLQDVKGITLHGDQGFSQKGPQAGNASYYFSQTRLVTNGLIKIEGDDYPVEGLSWMDHEFSTSALSGGQIGWDWFSIQLDDGSDFMVYQIRRADGTIDPFSSGTLVDPDGTTHILNLKDFEIQTGEKWHSPKTGTDYPVQWMIQVPQKELRLSLTPYMPEQEMDLSFSYWEGAVKVEGTYQGQNVKGSGYVEMTGYAKSMEGEF
jgi:predicted secreted hydrolase